MDTVRASLTDNWKFYYGDEEEAWFKGFDDSSWDDVMIPHDWSVEAPFSKEYSSGTGYLRGGTGWYRCHFKIPSEYEGKNIRITFDSIYKNSSVWINSYHIGKRPSGYASFSMDISEYVRYGDEENVIAVRVRHEDIADSRWFTGSGIVKKVTLTISEQVAPAMYGVWLDTRSLIDDAGKISARIRISNNIENKTDKDKKVRVRCVLEYDSAKEVSGDVPEEALIELFGETEVPADGMSCLKIDGIVDKPHLWSSDIPNIYKLSTYYSVDGGKFYLVDEQKTGIRVISMDPDKGFACNGVPDKLRGVCVHDDGGVVGSAMTKEIWQRRLELLKKAGCNAIRCAHNPHMPELYDLCDIMGFYVMDEAFDEWENAKNKWSHGHNVYPPRHQGYAEDFIEWHERDLVNMIERDRRHPSVILWSIGNEIDYPNDPYVNPLFKEFTGNNDSGKPAQEMIYNADKPDMKRLAIIAQNLSDIVRKTDTTRPATIAAAFPELSTKLGFIDSLDVVGYNYKEHLYEESHKRFPDKVFLGSENGHGIGQWRAVVNNDYICGQFLWTGIDYLGEAHGWPIHGAYSGLINTAGLPKPEYYKWKSLWTTDPFIKVFTLRPDEEKMEWISRTRSWNYKKGEKIVIKCYVPIPKKDIAEYGIEGKGGTNAIRNKDSDSTNAASNIDNDNTYTNNKENRNVGNNIISVNRNSRSCSNSFHIKTVKLYLNGILVGSTSQRSDDGSYRFETEFEPGKIEVRAELEDDHVSQEHIGASASDEKVISDSIYTSGQADHASISVYDRDDLVTGESFEEASSKKGYIYQVLVTLKDSDGRDVVCQDEEISASVSDNAQILGLDGGDLADNTDMRSPVRKTYQGKAVIYVRRCDMGKIDLDISFGDFKEHIEL